MNAARQEHEANQVKHMNKQTVSVSFPFLPILTLIFITLKLTGFITWSWFWVLSPIILPVLLILCGLTIWGAATLLIWVLKK